MTGSDGGETDTIRVVLSSPVESARVRLALKQNWKIALSLPDVPVFPGRGDRLLVSDLRTINRLDGSFTSLPTLLIAAPESLDGVSAIPEVDDVIVAPWTEEELRYRVSRILKDRRLVLGSAILAWNACELTVSGGSRTWRASLSPQGSELFHVLLRRRGVPVPRSVLARLVGLYAGAPGSRALDVSISRLRRGLATLGTECPVSLTVVGQRGRGYSLIVSQKDLVDNS